MLLHSQIQVVQVAVQQSIAKVEVEEAFRIWICFEVVDLFGGFDGFDVASPYGQRKRKRAICEVKAPDPSAAWKLVALRLASAYGELHTLPFGRPQSASPQKSARTSASGPTGKSSPRQSPRHPQNSVTWMRGKQYWSDIFVVVVFFFFKWNQQPFQRSTDSCEIPCSLSTGSQKLHIRSKATNKEAKEVPAYRGSVWNHGFKVIFEFFFPGLSILVQYL